MKKNEHDEEILELQSVIPTKCYGEHINFCWESFIRTLLISEDLFRRSI